MHIITDSTCDLPEEIARRYDITIVPYRVMVGGETFVDREEISPPEFWRRMAASKELPKTTPPTTGELAETFTRLAADGEPLLCITVSAKQSATYQSALIAKDVASVDVAVFDSMHASSGLGLTVLRAATLAEQGRTVPEIIEDLTTFRADMNQYTLVFTFENIVKGGRLSPAKGAISSVLGIRAILDYDDGEMVVVKKVRGHSKLIEAALDMVGEARPDLSDRQCVIAHVNNPEDAEYIRAQLSERYGAHDFIMTEVGATMSTYGGDKGITFAF